MKKSNRIRWLGAIAFGVILLLTLLAAPNTKLPAGSTYNRTPDGYGAWYAFMQQQGMPVQRWQKPFDELVAGRPITLLRVNSELSRSGLTQKQREWVEKGNTLVILGMHQPVTAAAFTTLQPSSIGSIKIDTRRRYVRTEEEQMLLGDRFGAVVWQEQIGAGQVIFATTPYLAANAYQEYLNNYKYLAQIVSKWGNPLWVDEYIHGYKDSSARETAGERGWILYLAQKPLFPALLQASIILLVLIWAHNQRFGQAIALEPPVVDNSAAYIEALAGVLQKAERNEFVVDVVGKAEQMQLQKALGLEQVSLDRQTLTKAWVEQTGRSPAELEQLRLQSQNRRISDKNLLIWLEKWQTIRTYAKPEQSLRSGR